MHQITSRILVYALSLHPIAAKRQASRELSLSPLADHSFSQHEAIQVWEPHVKQERHGPCSRGLPSAGPGAGAPAVTQRVSSLSVSGSPTAARVNCRHTYKPNG